MSGSVISLSQGSKSSIAAIQLLTMKDTYSIAEAQAQLPQLVRNAESGVP